jgi:hypothetical protein
MYSRLAGHTTFLYITDYRNNTIALQRDFGVRSSYLKKIYEKEVETRKKTMAFFRPDLPNSGALHVLRSFENLSPKKRLLEKLKPIHLWYVRVVLMPDYTINKKACCVGYISSSQTDLTSQPPTRELASFEEDDPQALKEQEAQDLASEGSDLVEPIQKRERNYEKKKRSSVELKTKIIDKVVYEDPSVFKFVPTPLCDPTECEKTPLIISV